MMFRRILLTSMLPLILALPGCASHQKAPGGTFDQVGRELREAIASKPNSVDEALNQAMLPPLQLDPPESVKRADEPRFDLAVSNAPAAQVFMAVVSGTPYSMLVAPEVSGTVTVNLKNVTLYEVLETLRELYGYEFKIQGTRIYIQPNTLQTRIFQINYLAGKRQGQSDVRVTSGSISSQSNSSTSGQPTTSTPPGSSSTSNTVPSSQVVTSLDSNFWGDLTSALTSIVGSADGRAVIVNPGSGVVLVKAFPTDIRAVENYLRMTQVIVERQVMLEAKILEVALSEEFQAGINWSWFGGRNHRFSAGSVNPGASLTTSGALETRGVTMLPGREGAAVATDIGQGLFGLAFQAASFASLLNFLESQGTVQVLSSPRIATLNNQKAVLKVGTDEFFVTNVSSTVTSTGNSNVTTPTITLQPFFSGIALDVTPQIDGENGIVLHVHPSISNVTENQKIINLGSLGTYTLPLASSTVNETDSIVRVQDSNIVAIGGLMKQEQSASGTGLPGASSASGFGWLFGSKDSYLRKSELVILIKPTIIRNASSWKDDLADVETRVRQYDKHFTLQPARSPEPQE
jgi:MSHA biogenesis protein MshL